MFLFKRPGFLRRFSFIFCSKTKIKIFHVFRKPKIRKLHIFTFFMNFDIFSKFLVLTRVGTLNLKNTRSMVVLSYGSDPGRNVPTRVGTVGNQQKPKENQQKPVETRFPAGFLCSLLASLSFPLVSFGFFWCLLVSFGFFWFPLVSTGFLQVSDDFSVVSFGFNWLPLVS